MRRPSKTIAAILALAAVAAALAAPTPALAAGTVRVEFYYGGVAACGAGLFIWFASSWETGWELREPSPALVNLRRGRLTVAPPSFGPGRAGEAETGGDPLGRWEMELFRWSF